MSACGSARFKGKSFVTAKGGGVILTQSHSIGVSGIGIESPRSVTKVHREWITIQSQLVLVRRECPLVQDLVT